MTDTSHVQTARVQRKIRTGVVTSNKMQKTIVVRVERHVRHPMYERIVPRGAKFKVHDAQNTAKPGDLVEIMETRPLSKDKRWRLVKVIREASTAPPVPEESSEVVGVERAREKADAVERAARGADSSSERGEQQESTA